MASAPSRAVRRLTMPATGALHLGAPDANHQLAALRVAAVTLRLCDR